MRHLLRNSVLPTLAGALLAMLLPSSAQAIEFRSLSEVAILYDSPSLEARRLYILQPGTPVEVIVQDGQWLKVREPQGAISWIESRVLSKTRTLLVAVDRAAVRRAPQDDAALSFEAERNVVLNLVSAPEPGWVKVRHADGAEGYVRANQVWGL